MTDAGRTRGVGVEAVHVGEGRHIFEDYRVKHALAIGINDYQHWPRLTAAVRGSREIGELLQDMYGFTTVFGSNVTRDEFYHVLGRFRGRAGNDKHSLFVLVFSGHGSDEGYMIPSDGERNEWDQWINYEDLCKRLRQLGYSHCLILLDCCYSGVITITKGGGITNIPPEMVRIDFDPSAAVITAGADNEQVYDSGHGGRSHFAAALLSALGSGLSAGNATLVSSIYSYVHEYVTMATNGLVHPRFAENTLPSQLGGRGRIVIYRRGFRITTTSLPDATVNKEYHAQLATAEGTPPCRWSAKELPTHLEINAGTGEITGIPGKTGEFTVIVDAEDAGGKSASRELTLKVVEAVKEDKDYCTVAAGEYALGYHSSPEREAELNALANQYADFPSQDDLNRSYPSHRVALHGFRIKKTPVTNREYMEFVRATGHRKPTHCTGDAKDGFIPQDTVGQLKDHHPVVCVSYSDAAAYCAWRGTRLPTAREWEVAASGGCDGRLFPWGDEFDKDKCNTAESALGKTRPVGQGFGDKSPFGVLDMTGNVAEWVDGGEVEVDASGTVVRFRRVRGGSWGDAGRLYGMCFMKSKEIILTDTVFRPAGVTLDIKEERNHWIGFRDVIDPDAGPVPEQRLVNIPGGRLEWRKVSCGPFSMARFAVSNMEYLEFVRATGHRRPEHWSAGDPPFPDAERYWPVVNVSQADATVFCQWKAEQMRRPCRLPSDAQWELAACGREGRDYPWGPKYEFWRCNSKESGWGRPVNVFDLPEGMTPEGVYNLCGNVFEWLNSPRDSRGGSWRHKNSCETVGRGKLNMGNPNEYDGDTGFRYVSTPV